MITDLKQNANLPVGALSSWQIYGNMLHTSKPTPPQFRG